MPALLDGPDGAEPGPAGDQRGPPAHLGHRRDRGAAPPERAGAASAISETGSELGGALGIALLGSLATAVYGREALTQGLQLTAAISAAVVLATAIVAAVVLRQVRTA